MIKNIFIDMLTKRYIGCECPSRNMKWTTDYECKNYKIYTFGMIVIIACLPRHKCTDVSLNIRYRNIHNLKQWYNIPS